MSESNVSPVASAPASGRKLSQGMYMVGLFRGVVVRNGTSRDNKPYSVTEAVIEGDNFAVQRWALTKEQADAGWSSSLLPLVGKTCLFPVSVQKNGEYVNYRLRGNVLPSVIG